MPSHIDAPLRGLHARLARSMAEGRGFTHGHILADDGELKVIATYPVDGPDPIRGIVAEIFGPK